MVVRRSVAVLVAGTLGVTGTAFAQTAPPAGPAGDPPARVGRLAYLQGTVSYHDAKADSWSAAAVNTPITSGDAVWTEPNGHDELSISGTRVRMDGDTQLDVSQLNDSQTRLQLDQGRLDIKTVSLDTNQPYQIATPRGVAALKDQGDYYIHAGTTAEPTVMGVRAGAAEFQAANGQTIALKAGEEAQITGDVGSLQIQKVETAPPAMPTYWAQRDQQINYAPVQYLSADVTGYEDLGAYGSWNNDPDYGQVWSPQGVAANWTPYSTGYWSYVDPWGWTWVDSSPWGYAPYHYGRWGHRGDRWFWMPPGRNEHSVYAPALVAFIGGTELGVAIGAQNRNPVGWFPLGPREAYVPPYTTDRAYYQRLNANAGVPANAMNDRWQRAEQHQTLTANNPNEQFANRRFATVVPAQDFASSRPVQQSRIQVSADKVATAPAAAVAAPPAPTMALAAQPANRTAQPQATAGQPAVAQTRFANMETIARPAANAQQHGAPGPRISSTQPNAPNAAPPLPGRAGAQPRANEVRPGQTPLANQAVQPPHPGEPARPNEARPNEARPSQPPLANQAVQPHPAEAPRANEQHPAAPAQAEHVAPTQPQHVEPQHPAAPAQAEHVAPPQPQRVEPQHAEPQHVEPQHAAPQPQAPHPAPQQAQAPHPAPAPQAAPHPAPAPAPAKQEEKK
jgi:FecR protein